MLTAKEFWTKENNQELNDDYDYFVINVAQAYGDYVKSELANKPVEVVKVDNTEAIKVLENAISLVSNAHIVLAKTGLPSKVNSHILSKISKAKVALFSYYQTLLPCATPVD